MEGDPGKLGHAEIGAEEPGAIPYHLNVFLEIGKRGLSESKRSARESILQWAQIGEKGASRAKEI